MPGGTEGEKGMKDYEKLSSEHFDEMADNYAATDGLYYTPLPKLACDEAAALLKGERFGAMPDRNNTNQVPRRRFPPEPRHSPC